MMEAYGVRPASEADYDFIWRVACTTMREYVAAIWGWDDAWQEQRFRGNFGAASWNVIVVGGQDAGALQYGHRPPDGDLFLANIYLLPEYQRRGIGSAIVKGLMAEALAANVPFALTVLRSNPGALRLYERLGLKVVNENDERSFMSTEAPDAAGLEALTPEDRPIVATDLRTDYVGHDSVYQVRKAKGLPGWSDLQTIQENVAALNHMLQGEHVPRSGRLLEMGCGAGDLSLWLATLGYQVSGVDISPTAIAWAREKACERGIEADYRVGNVLDLADFADASFDFVLDGHCLHCIIGKDRALFLSSAFRVLKPGGFLHIGTMCGDPVTEGLREGYDIETRCTIHNGIATRYLGHREDIEAEVRAAGFTISLTRLSLHETNEDQDMLFINALRPK